MMRRLLQTVLMGLLLGAFGARAEEPARPVPTDGQCPAAADEHWTPQEKFVWSRVCVGQTADFNTAPEYGGDLDPKQAQALPDSRILSSAFIETILLADKYRRALTRNGVRIVGARFREPLDLRHAELAHELWLDHSLLEQGANFAGVRSTSRITLDGTRVKGVLNFTDARIDGDISLGKSELADLNMFEAHIGSGLSLSEARSGGHLFLDLLHVAGNLDMSATEFSDMRLFGAEIAGSLMLFSTKSSGPLSLIGGEIFGHVLGDQGQFADLTVAGTHIHGQFGLPRSKIGGTLDMAGVRIDGNLALNSQSDFNHVRLVNAQLQGNVGIDTAKVHGLLDMTNAQIDGSLDMSGAEFAEVNLIDAHVAGFVTLIGSKASGLLNFADARIDGNLAMRDKAEFTEINLLNARIGGVLNLRESKVAGMLNLESIEVHGDAFLSGGAEFSGPVNLIFSSLGELELASGTFRDTVDITGAQIRSDLVLGPLPAHWTGKSALILHNARANAIQDTNDAWPAKLDLTGFTYRSLGGVHPDEHDRMADRPVRWFRRWLAKEQYSPQPYVQLAAVLRDAGRPDAADDILYAGKQRERREATWPQRVWLTALDWSVGYGYHVERALFWVVGFILAGVVVLRVSGEGRRHGMPFGFAYSFDLLLPIIRLREMHYTIELAGWPRYYFYVHKIMGYVLASFLVVGVSGLVK